MYKRITITILSAIALWAQEAAPPAPEPRVVLARPLADGDPAPVSATPVAPQAALAPQVVVVEPGTHIPVTMLNSVSTKGGAVGDRVYLQTIFPIQVQGRTVIPPGSYVAGTLTEVKRPGRGRGNGALFVRFDSMTLPNGVTRDFRARIGQLDGRANEKLNRSEGKIESKRSRGEDAVKVAEAGLGGASLGVIGGAVTGSPGLGAGIGGAVGAAIGLTGVLLSRGPEATLQKGTTLEMVLDRPVEFATDELRFGPNDMRPMSTEGGPSQPAPRQRRRLPL